MKRHGSRHAINSAVNIQKAASGPKREFFPALTGITLAAVSILILTMVISPLSLFGQNGRNSSARAREIAERMIYRNDGRSIYRDATLMTCRYRETDGVFKCVGQPVVKKIEVISLDTGNDLKDTVNLAVIREPVSERNTAFLQKDYDNRPDSDQWMYFPALRKLKRIVSQSPGGPRTGSIFGTEFSYEDNERLRPDEYIWSYLGMEVTDGKECYALEAVPTNERRPRSSYSRMLFWTDRESMISLKREYYDKRGVLAKTIFAKQLSRQNGIWIVTAEILVNHLSGRMSFIRTDSVAVNPDIRPELFEQRGLQDGSFREQALESIRSQAVSQAARGE